MLIVGARFEDEDRAVEALHTLRARYSLDRDDAEAAPLGTTDYGTEAPHDSIVAARVDPADVAEIERLVEQLGGEVVVVRDEPIPHEPSGAPDPAS